MSAFTTYVHYIFLLKLVCTKIKKALVPALKRGICGEFPRIPKIKKHLKRGNIFPPIFSFFKKGTLGNTQGIMGKLGNRAIFLFLRNGEYATK